MRLSKLALAALISLPLATLAEVPSPQLGAVELAQPLPLPYNLQADAKAEVDAALARARISGKRVIVDLGGNWCPDCRVFAGILGVPEVRKFVDEHFEVVLVNVGRYDTNLDIPARWGIDKLAAAPTTLIVSPTGELLNKDDTVALRDARAMTPQAVVDWLAHWAAPAKQANKAKS
jgi:thiol-disulfide isomerase/thioredoxin